MSHVSLEGAQEWQALVAALEAAGVEVLTADAQGLPEPCRPPFRPGFEPFSPAESDGDRSFRGVLGGFWEDEVFPNNWFSTHSDGRVVIYPMKVPSRAAEVREDVLSLVRRRFKLQEIHFGPVFSRFEPFSYYFLARIVMDVLIEM